MTNEIISGDSGRQHRAWKYAQFVYKHATMKANFVENKSSGSNRIACHTYNYRPTPIKDALKRLPASGGS